MTKTFCDVAGCTELARDSIHPEQMLIVVSHAEPYHAVTIELTGYGDLCDEHFRGEALAALHGAFKQPQPSTPLTT